MQSRVRLTPTVSPRGRSSTLRASTAIAVFLVAIISQGCRVGPNYTPPAEPLPDAWHAEISEGLVEGQSNLHTWWRTLDDPALEGLIVRAVEGNRDLRVAVGRVREARARYGFSSGNRFPDVDGVGSYERRSDKVGDFSNQQERRLTENYYGSGFDATWEIDVFGRVSRSIESAEADYQATIEDYRDVLVSLLADVALNYVQLRTLQRRLEVVSNNVGTQKGTLRLTINRFEAELVGQLDVRQAEQNLASTESFIPALRRGVIAAVNRLSVLIGVPPGELATELDVVAPIPSGQGPLSVGVPADLLRQRPDVRSAERTLAARTAQIGVATADLYPRFTLSGVFAFEGSSAGIFKPDGITWGFGPQFRWNIFDGGRIRSLVKVEDARTEQALSAYEQTVLLALEDVENSMVAYEQEKLRRDALRRSVTAAQQSVSLVDTLYRTGLVDFQNVLDTQRTQFNEEDRLAQSDGFVTQNLIRIYRALGGGWSGEKQPAAAQVVTAPGEAAVDRGQARTSGTGTDAKPAAATPMARDTGQETAPKTVSDSAGEAPTQQPSNDS